MASYIFLLATDREALVDMNAIGSGGARSQPGELQGQNYELLRVIAPCQPPRLRRFGRTERKPYQTSISLKLPRRWRFFTVAC